MGGISNEQFAQIIKPVLSTYYDDTWYVPLYYSRCRCFECHERIPTAWLMYCHHRPSPFPVESTAKDRVYLHVTGEGRYPANLNEKDVICDACYRAF